MNYERIYGELVGRSKRRDHCPGYAERHHVTPRSMGGNDSPDNIVLLTPREHYIAHWLLHKIYKNKKMSAAWNSMCMNRDGVRYTSSTFQYARNAHAMALGRAVLCVDTGEVFRSMRHATLALDGVSSTVFLALNSDGKCYGLTLKWHEGPAKFVKSPVRSKAAKMARPKGSYRKPVKCMETNEVFRMLSDAAKAARVNNPSMHESISNGRKCAGLTFDYTDDQPTVMDPESSVARRMAKRKGNLKSVRCLETGDVFGRFKDAAKWLGVDGSAISRAVSLGRPVKGMRFEISETPVIALAE